MGGIYLTANCPGTGGSIKMSPGDFQIEEIPLYLPCGEGEHLYLFVEKKGITTLEMIRKIAVAAGLRERDIGYAGLKDARGIARQWISLPAPKLDPGSFVGDDFCTVIEARPHRNKLRLGHLKGNRFRIRIRGTLPGAFARATATLAELERKGVPNRFGPQRFGAMGNSHLVGRALVRRDFQTAAREIVGRPGQIREPAWKNGIEKFHNGDLPGALEELPRTLRHERLLIEGLLRGKPVKNAVMTLPRRLLRLYVSAYQAELFDRIVTRRITDLGTLWQGDLAVKHNNGAFFLVPDPAREQPRADAFEISPSGPLFGFKSPLAQGPAGDMEKSLLREENLTPEDFRLAGGLKMEGSRRPLRVPVEVERLEREGDDLIVSFTLPAGAYATNVTDEIMKTG